MSAAKFKIESGAQLLARLIKKPDLENFYPTIFPHGLKKGEVIEVFSDGCTSHFINEIISEALIQTRSKGVTAGVLFFKTDGNTNYNDLFDVIKKKITTQSDSCPRKLDDEFKDIVTNFHTVDVYDVTQYYITIHNLENILMEYSNITLIIFDTLTAFYWSEQGSKITKMDFYIKNLINSTQKVTKEYKTVCLYTRPAYFCTNKDANYIPAELNYQIHITENTQGIYQINLKSISLRATKFFKIVNKELKWLHEEK